MEVYSAGDCHSEGRDTVQLISANEFTVYCTENFQKNKSPFLVYCFYLNVGSSVDHSIALWSIELWSLDGYSILFINKALTIRIKFLSD